MGSSWHMKEYARKTSLINLSLPCTWFNRRVWFYSSLASHFTHYRNFNSSPFKRALIPGTVLLSHCFHLNSDLSLFPFLLTTLVQGLFYYLESTLYHLENRYHADSTSAEICCIALTRHFPPTVSNKPLRLQIKTFKVHFLTCKQLIECFPGFEHAVAKKQWSF